MCHASYVATLVCQRCLLANPKIQTVLYNVLRIGIGIVGSKNLKSDHCNSGTICIYFFFLCFKYKVTCVALFGVAGNE